MAGKIVHPQWNHSVADNKGLLPSSLVKWRTIREAFISLREERGWVQADVAMKGGLPQSAISKLESNDNLGPSVEVFTKAVEGLGITLSQFFARIEGLTSSVHPSLNPPHGSGSGGVSHHGRAVPSSVDAALAALPRTADELQTALARLHRDLSELGAISEAVRERAESFVLAPPAARGAAAPIAASREHRVPRQRGRKSARKTR